MGQQCARIYSAADELQVKMTPPAASLRRVVHRDAGSRQSAVGSRQSAVGSRQSDDLGFGRFAFHCLYQTTKHLSEIVRLFEDLATVSPCNEADSLR